MSLTYGFYNSLNHDRKYDARQIGMLFDGLITDGVYRSIGRAFAVSVNSGMILNVAEGRAWFDHTWTLNDTVMTVALPAAHSVYTKIVAVINVKDNNPLQAVYKKCESFNGITSIAIQEADEY